MSLLRRAFGIDERAIDLPDGYGTPGYGAWGQGMVWQSSSSVYSGSTDSAMRLSAVFACLRLLSEAISTLPLDTFRREGGTRLPYPTPDYLSFQPPQQSRITYLSQVMLSLLTDGNAFIATPRNPMGVPVDLIPLDPTKVKVSRERGQITFEVGGERYDDMDILHIPGMMLPQALRGISPIAAAREVIDSGKSMQDFGRHTFTNQATPPAVISVPGDKSKDQARAIAANWHETHGGTSNAGKIGVLTGGATLNTVSFSPEDSQWLESRRFGIGEIARFFGVPLHLINDSTGSTSWGSGLAEQNLAFGQFSLRSWTERIDNGHSRLLTTHGLSDVFVKLNLDAMLRASLADRYAAYAVGLSNEFLDVDEVRALEDLPPREKATANSMSSRDLAEALQKIYLAVDKVISAEEAREILNREGAGLTGRAPGGAA